MSKSTISHLALERLDRATEALDKSAAPLVREITTQSQNVYRLKLAEAAKHDNVINKISNFMYADDYVFVRSVGDKLDEKSAGSPLVRKVVQSLSLLKSAGAGTSVAADGEAFNEKAAYVAKVIGVKGFARICLAAVGKGPLGEGAKRYIPLIAAGVASSTSLSASPDSYALTAFVGFATLAAGACVLYCGEALLARLANQYGDTLKVEAKSRSLLERLTVFGGGLAFGGGTVPKALVDEMKRQAKEGVGMPGIYRHLENADPHAYKEVHQIATVLISKYLMKPGQASDVATELTMMNNGNLAEVMAALKSRRIPEPWITKFGFDRYMIYGEIAHTSKEDLVERMKNAPNASVQEPRKPAVGREIDQVAQIG